jgi:hypothetical protein
MSKVFRITSRVFDNRRLKTQKIKGVSWVTGCPNKYGAFNLPAVHMFKIRNGKICEVEAIGYMG